MIKKPQLPVVKNFPNMLIYEKTSEGEEMYDVFSRLMKERVIFVTGEIEEDSTNVIMAQLLWLSHQDSKKEIDLYINSPGGHVLCLFALYDVMQFIKAPIRTVVLGEAASAAAVLLASGQDGQRMAAPNSQVMIHQPWVGGVGGQVTDISIEVIQLEKLKRKLIEILARHVKKPYEEVEQDCERNYYLDAQQALDYGIVDSIIPFNKDIPELISLDADLKKATKKLVKKSSKKNANK